MSGMTQFGCSTSGNQCMRRVTENNLSQEGPHMGFFKCLSSSRLIIPILGHLGCVCALNKEHMSNRTEC